MLSFDKHPVFKGVLISSCIMALLGMGDALLYSVLPVYGQLLGLSPLWVGILLSANRLVRLIGNTWVANIISTYGYKKVMLVATFTAVLTTSLYGLGLGLTIFLLVRMIWGLTFSMLRTSSLAYAAEADNKNLMFGLNTSIKTFGASVALLVGPLLITTYDIKATFLILAALGLLAIPLCLALPELQAVKESHRYKALFTATRLSTPVFFFAFIVDGVLVVSLASLLESNSPSQLVALVGGYLLFRKLSTMIVPALLGWLSHYIHAKYMMTCALIGIVFSLIFIASGDVIGILGTFLFGSYITIALPALAVTNTKSKLVTLTAITTWWDIGAALGTLVGLFLIQVIGSSVLFAAFSIIITIVSISIFRITFGHTSA